MGWPDEILPPEVLMAETERLTQAHFAELLRRRDDAGLLRLLHSADPADVADLLETVESEDASRILSLLNTEQASDVLVELDPEETEEMVESLDPARLAAMIDEMAPDDAVDFFQELDEEDRPEVLARLPEERQQELRRLLGYEEDSAGGLMTPELCAVPSEATVGDALHAIAAQEFSDPISKVFVHDKDRRLVGEISLSDLLAKPHHARIAEVVDREPVSARVDQDQEEIANLFRKYDLYVMPVVDAEGRLVGRITADDVMDVMHEEAGEDLARLSGAPDLESQTDSAWLIARLRLPWLLVTMASGLVISEIIRRMTGMTWAEGLSLAAFVPAIMAMGGNTGMQSSTVTIRSIALGEIRADQLARRFLREIFVGFLMGVVCGLVAGVLVWASLHAFGGEVSHPTGLLAAIVGASMCSAMTFAAFCGTLIPIILQRLDIDPALASGPFVTTGNDLSASLIYFATCYLLLQLA
jgi:magnesium transporter